MALSMLPADASSAFLQSIIGEPVFSLSSLTMAGVTVLDVLMHLCAMKWHRVGHA